ncbi:CsbD family protein [Janthinobacterium svalbardensis]|uniref:CsbD family protein n=1 Tax=Janthinobacterium svalbardensis TaxID=368607 RepID=UPI0012FD4D17|nr:CsbD family protein [Janthinobacterium svalbardensis]
MSFFSDLIGVPLSVVELAGKAIEVIGEVTDNDALKTAGKSIQDSADTISK